MLLGATSQAALLTWASQPGAAPTSLALADPGVPGGMTMSHSHCTQHQTLFHPSSLHLVPPVPV